MAEAMGFELMDLLQSTVFKSMLKQVFSMGYGPKYSALIACNAPQNGRKRPIAVFQEIY
jgi:hypothetical protein